MNKIETCFESCFEGMTLRKTHKGGRVGWMATRQSARPAIETSRPQIPKRALFSHFFVTKFLAVPGRIHVAPLL